MRNFVVYDKAGKILRTGRCSDSLFDLQAKAGETVIEGKANDVTDMVKKGKVRKGVNKPKERPASVLVPARKKSNAL